MLCYNMLHMEREYNPQALLMGISYTPVYLGSSGMMAIEMNLGDYVKLSQEAPEERMNGLKNILKNMSEEALSYFPHAASVEVCVNGELATIEDSEIVLYQLEDRENS